MNTWHYSIEGLVGNEVSTLIKALDHVNQVVSVLVLLRAIVLHQEVPSLGMDVIVIQFLVLDCLPQVAYT